ncbi:hypothetical protein D7044_08845 [Micromonospora musae]|uniref:Permease n=1 Tax=Micromonospora musae TaxID=1894970 RepID=A0A3A9Y8A2_9ACTN|nr:hypothetical protein D7044_08845 [Micromonospora musae]
MAAPERIAPPGEKETDASLSAEDQPHALADRLSAARSPIGNRIGSLEILTVLLLLLLVMSQHLTDLLAAPALATWTTVFVSVMVQAVPFLVFGVLLSAAIAVFVPRCFWARALPRHPALALPVTSVAVVVLPGCECGAVPIAGSLIRSGVTPAAALAFLLAAPAINPIVLAATADATQSTTKKSRTSRSTRGAR